MPGNNRDRAYDSNILKLALNFVMRLGTYGFGVLVSDRLPRSFGSRGEFRDPVSRRQGSVSRCGVVSFGAHGVLDVAS